MTSVKFNTNYIALKVSLADKIGWPAWPTQTSKVTMATAKTLSHQLVTTYQYKQQHEPLYQIKMADLQYLNLIATTWWALLTKQCYQLMILHQTKANPRQFAAYWSVNIVSKHN